MKRTFIRSALAVALFGAAVGAQAQVALECPSGAAGPATPITLYTGADWQMRYGASGTWESPHTSYYNSSWYPGGGPPADGSWLTPGPISPPIPTVDPWYYRTPVIEVDPRIELDSIAVAIQHAVDNRYIATGVMNSAQPDGVMVAGNGGHNNHSTLGTGFTPALTGWITGDNRVLIQTENAEAAHGPSPTGLYAILNITAQCVAGTPNVSVDIGSVPTTGAEGQPYSGSFSCTNGGTAAATDAACTLTGLPAGVTVGACTISPNDDPWTSPGTIPEGETVTCPVSGTPESGSAGTYPLTGTGGTATATATLTIAGVPDVVIDLNGLPSVGTLNQLYSGSFTCTNNGMATASGAACEVTDLPPGITLQGCTISPNGDSWTSPADIPQGEVVTCTVGGTPTQTGSTTASGTGGSSSATRSITIRQPAAAVPVPTLGTLGLALTGALLAGFVGLMARRQRRRG